MIDWLIDWLIDSMFFTSHSKDENIPGDFTFASECCKMKVSARRFRPLIKDGSLSCHTRCDTGPRFYGLVWGTARVVTLDAEVLFLNVILTYSKYRLVFTHLTGTLQDHQWCFIIISTSLLNSLFKVYDMCLS